MNGAKKGNGTELEKLMHDFSCTQADDMYYKQLADRMRFFKESEEGVETMCKVIEDMRDDLRASIALEMIKDGTLSLEKIAKFSGLSLEKVRELASMKTA